MHLRRVVLIAVTCWLAASGLAADPSVNLAPVPFINLSDYRGRLLDRRAAAAVAVHAAEAWLTLDPGMISQAISDLELPWPLGTAELQRLCNRLDDGRVKAGAAVTGVVSEVQVDGTRVQVSLYLDLFEPLSGEVVDRAQGVGRVRADQPTPLDTLVEQALQEAVRAALQKFGPGPVVVGQVKELSDEETLLVELATDTHLSAKTVLLVLGETEQAVFPVATVVVQGTENRLARGRIVGHRGVVRAGQTVVAIGRLP